MKRFIMLLVVVMFATTSLSFAQSKAESDQFISVVRELIDQGHTADALEAVDAMLVSYPKNADLYNLKSVVYLEDDNYQDALLAVNQALKFVSRKSYWTEADLYFCRAMIYYSAEHYTLAIEDLTTSLKCAKKSEVSRILDNIDMRAECYFNIDEYELSKADLNTILQVCEDDLMKARAMNNICTINMYTENYYEAIKVATELLEYPEYKGAAYKTLFESYFYLDEYQKSIDYVVDCVLEYPSQVTVDDVNWSFYYDMPYAREVVRKKIEEDTELENISTFIRLCNLCEDYEKSLELVDLIPEGEIEINQRYKLRSEVLGYMGKFDEALELLNEFCSIADNDELRYYAHFYRAVLNINIGNYENSIADLDVVSSILPNPYSDYLKGCCYQYMGDYESALQCYCEAVAGDNDEVEYLFSRGQMYYKMGNIKAAKSDFERILEIDSEVDINSRRHFALFYLGRYEEADEWMMQLVKEYTFNNSVYLDAAILYALLGDAETSVNYLGMAIDFGFNSKACIEDDYRFDSIRDNDTYKLIMRYSF